MLSKGSAKQTHEANGQSKNLEVMIEARANRMPDAILLGLSEAPLQRSVLQAHVPLSPSQLDWSDDMPQVLTVGKSLIGKCA